MHLLKASGYRPSTELIYELMALCCFSLPSWSIKRYQSKEGSTVSLPKWKHYDNSLSKTRQKTPKHSWHPAQRHQATACPLFIPIISQNRYMLLPAEKKWTFALIPSAAQPSSGPDCSKINLPAQRLTIKMNPMYFKLPYNEERKPLPFSLQSFASTSHQEHGTDRC